MFQWIDPVVLSQINHSTYITLNIVYNLLSEFLVDPNESRREQGFDVLQYFITVWLTDILSAGDIIIYFIPFDRALHVDLIWGI